MGMFDSVRVKCPKCSAVSEAQSKSGPCLLFVADLPTKKEDYDRFTSLKFPAKAYSKMSFDLEEFELVLKDINRHAPFVCRECLTKFFVKPITLPPFILYTTEVF